MAKIFYLLNTAFQTVYVIEKYESMIWTPRYYEMGDFELYLPANKESIDIFTEAAEKHYYIVDGDDLTHAMIATKIEKETSNETGPHISLTGFDLKYLFKKRVIWGTTYISGNAETELRRIITENVINPKVRDRKIHGVYLGPESEEIDNIVSSAAKGGYVSDVIASVCKTYHFGWDVTIDLSVQTLDPDFNRFQVIFYKGKDRSVDQDVNQRVIFSKKFENLLTTNHKIDTSNYRNVVYVDGFAKDIEQGTTSNVYPSGIETRVTKYRIVKKDYGQVVTLDNEQHSGQDRYEAYVEGGEQDNTNDSRSDLNKFRYTLKMKGKVELDKFEVSKELTGKVVPNITNYVGINYGLGDEINVINEFDQKFKARVTEVIKTSNDKGYTEIPSFAVEDPKNDPDEIKATDARCDESFDHYRVSEDGEIRVQEKGLLNEERATEDGEARITDNGLPPEGSEIKPEGTPRVSAITEYERELNELVLSSHEYKGG